MPTTTQSAFDNREPQSGIWHLPAINYQFDPAISRNCAAGAVAVTQLPDTVEHRMHPSADQK